MFVNGIKLLVYDLFCFLDLYVLYKYFRLMRKSSLNKGYLFIYLFTKNVNYYNNFCFNRKKIKAFSLSLQGNSTDEHEEDESIEVTQTNTRGVKRTIEIVEKSDREKENIPPEHTQCITYITSSEKRKVKKM